MIKIFLEFHSFLSHPEKAMFPGLLRGLIDLEITSTVDSYQKVSTRRNVIGSNLGLTSRTLGIIGHKYNIQMYTSISNQAYA
jgi:hypothetical protein